MNRLESGCEQALDEGKLKGLVAVFYENERPLKGLAGLMDWRSRGLISRCLREGSISGRVGECVYVPVPRADGVCHVLLVGGGQLTRYGRRGLIPDEAFGALRKNARTLGIEGIGLSRAEFGGLNDEYLEQQLQGAPLWILP